MVSLRVAVLSDVHGNHHALKAVLDDIRQEEISSIIVAGDSTGPIDQNKVYSTLFENKAIMIRGNGEKRIVTKRRGRISDSVWEQKSYAGNRWMYTDIEPFTKNYLEFLPDQRRVDFDNANPIRVVHGSPHDKYTAQGILPELESSDSQKLMNVHSTISIEEAVEGLEEKVLVCGHTHRPWTKTIDGILVVNPGSVGNPCNRDPRADYAILNWEKDQWTVESRAIPYDKQSMYDEYVQSGILEAVGAFARLTLLCRMTGVDVNLDFLTYVKSLVTEEGLSYEQAYPAAANSFNWKKYGDILPFIN